MALLGRWPALDDGMSPCLPGRTMAMLRRRRALGDRDATTWLELHARAYAGDADAQLELGRVCENGLHRTGADLQRAFFWYYRASLQGDLKARWAAERLMRATKICPAALADPLLVFPGGWRITAQLSARLDSKCVFDLAEDGITTGELLEDAAYPLPVRPDRESGRTARGAAAAPIRYRGGWAFDGFGNVLTIVFDASDAGARRWRSDCWQIGILGCREGALFGRDRRNVAYTLEHVVANS